jgi:hypothetical protein
MLCEASSRQFPSKLSIVESLKLLLTAKAQVHAWVNPCGIYGGQTVTGTGFILSSSVFPCQYYSTLALHTYTSSGG